MVALHTENHTSPESTNWQFFEHIRKGNLAEIEKTISDVMKCLASRLNNTAPPTNAVRQILHLAEREGLNTISRFFEQKDVDSLLHFHSGCFTLIQKPEGLNEAQQKMLRRIQMIAMRHLGNAIIGHLSNSTGTTPLITAVVNGQAEIVDHLIKIGVSANHKDSKGESPLSHAARLDHKERNRIINMLVKAGGEVNRKDPAVVAAIEEAIEPLEGGLPTVYESADEDFE